jgi:hypothetical protein
LFFSIPVVKKLKVTSSFVVSVAFQEKPEVVKSKISKRPIMQLSPSTPQDNDAPKLMETTSGERKSLWEGSSQYRHWRFSPETLLSQRTRINEAAVKAIRDTFEAQEVSNPVVIFCCPSYITTQAGSSDGIEFLNAQEEYALVKLYVDKIPPLCAHFRFNDEVESTAMTYLKRFYLHNTAMDWHPKNVMWVSKISTLSILSTV